jgi:hypothetical protein
MLARAAISRVIPRDPYAHRAGLEERRFHVTAAGPAAALFMAALRHLTTGVQAIR